MPTIVSKFDGKCRQCGKRHLAGDRVVWVKGVKGVLCVECGQGNAPTAPTSPSCPNPPTPTPVAPRKDESGRTVRKWDSWASYVQSAEEGADRSFGTSHDRTRVEWSGTKTFNEAISMARRGWSEVRPEVDALVEKIESKVGEFVQPAFTTYFDVTGGAVDVARYLDGEPECMVETRLVEIAKPGRVIPILISGFYSSFSDAESIIKRGAGIIALVETLEKLQHTTEIWIEISFRGGEGYTYLIPIKAAGETLDIDQLMFIVANPAAFRRINFAIQEGESFESRERFHLGARYSYGRPSDLTQGDALGAAVKLERMTYDAPTADPDVWIETVLGEFGLLREA